MPSERGKPPSQPLHRAGPFGKRPGSPNRGFASIDPERQREPPAGEADPGAPADAGAPPRRAPRQGGPAGKPQDGGKD